MALIKVSEIEFNDRLAKSSEQDQTTLMCSLILLDTHRKFAPRTQDNGYQRLLYGLFAKAETKISGVIQV